MKLRASMILAVGDRRVYVELVIRPPHDSHARPTMYVTACQPALGDKGCDVPSIADMSIHKIEET